jgi:lysophospholipase L1-like esterase
MRVPWIDSRTVAHAPEHYIPNDGHFSAAGNAIMGEALAEKLAPLLRR